MISTTAATALLAVCVGSAGATPREDVPGWAAMVDAVSRDLGISRDQARTKLVRQAQAQRVAEALPDRVRANSPGWWIDEDTGMLVVAVTEPAAADLVRALGGEPRPVSRSRDDLAQLSRAVGELAGAGVPGLAGWGVDSIGNSVVVRVNPAKKNVATQQFLARVGELGAGVRVREVAASPEPQAGDVRPGNPWFPGYEGNCSVGFAAVDASGGKHFLTAGHCTNDRDQPAFGASGGQNRIGTSNVGGARSVFAREGDMGVVAVTEPGWNLSASVNTWGNAPVAVTGTTEPIVNQAVCHSGVASRWQCGRVTAVEQTVMYSSGPIDGMSFTTACSLGGDSGGAWVAGDKAVGLHSGGYPTCGPGNAPDQSLFQPVNEALRKWGLTLYTGGGNTGDTLAPSAPSDVRATSTTASSVTLAWTASTDNVGVAGYQVYNGSTLAATVQGTTATIGGLVAATSYSFTVRAKDAAGNVSPPSAPVTARTTDGGSRTFRSDTDYQIRDYQQISSPIRSTTTGSTAQIRVDVTAQHTCVEDLDIDVLSPSGRWYSLHDFGGYVCHPFGGTRSFTVPVSYEQAAGTWTLYIRDGGPGDIGYLDSWVITL
ncbi:fibronectin type III domain-containing protein [Actinokineospora xionganensis]|nr:proprotein convertase P-domain-containing protein [Actinokineospora xionganensis]